MCDKSVGSQTPDQLEVHACAFSLVPQPQMSSELVHTLAATLSPQGDTRKAAEYALQQAMDNPGRKTGLLSSVSKS